MTFDKANKIVVTTGTSFSGSTILSLLLDSHPDVVALGDGLNPQILKKRAQTYTCSCGERIVECRFWTEVEQRMQELDPSFSLADCNMRFSKLWRPWDVVLGRYYSDGPRRTIRTLAERFAPAYRRHVRLHIRRNLLFCQAVLASSGKSVYVHNAKPLLMLHYLLNDATLDPVVLHIVRDPRGFVASASKREMTVAQAANRWVRYHESVLQILSRTPADKILMIPYEDICNDTQALLNNIFRFFDVEPCTISSTVVPPEHHVLGNDLRLRERFDLEMDLSWRDRLSKVDTAMVRRICGKTYDSLGFDWE